LINSKLFSTIHATLQYFCLEKISGKKNIESIALLKLETERGEPLIGFTN